VVSRSGTIGKAGGVGTSLGPAVACGGLYIIRPNAHRLDPAWLLGYLRTRECQQWMQKRSRGSVIMCVTVAICAGMQMPLPPLDVQRKALARSQTSGEGFLQSLAAILGVQ
jgi:type I restriction enzyme M protein